MAFSAELRNPKAGTSTTQQQQALMLSQLGPLIGNPALFPFTAQSPSLSLSSGVGHGALPSFLSQVVPQMANRFQQSQKAAPQDSSRPTIVQSFNTPDQTSPAEHLQQHQSQQQQQQQQHPRTLMRPNTVQESCEIPNNLNFSSSSLLSDGVPDSLSKW